ncbi:MAG: phage portal protein [Rickettsiaceae bacterium]
MINQYLRKIFATKQAKTNKSYDVINLSDQNFLEGLNKSNVNPYQTNVIVYRCVSLIAQSASHVPITVKKNTLYNNDIAQANNHSVYQLLKNPNPDISGMDFLSEIISHVLLFGNAYILASGYKGQSPRELHLLHPNSTSLVLKNNTVIGYKYNTINGEKLFRSNPVDRHSNVLHLKNYHPTNKHYGLSYLDPASLSINSHNKASVWNNALFQNGARPTGALIVDDPAGYLTDEQFQRLKDQLYDKFSGSSNAGKILLLDNRFKWQEMSINPKDMDFIESKNTAAREIALAFGVPPQLLGINGDNTYSNMQEARLALWEETIIPLLERIAHSLSNWMSQLYQESLMIDFDLNSVSALTEKRKNLWERISAAEFMTTNEKRALIGLEPIEDGNKL